MFIARITTVFLVSFFLFVAPIHAQEEAPLEVPPQTFYEGVITSKQAVPANEAGVPGQEFQIILSSGEKKGQTVTVNREVIDAADQNTEYTVGDRVVVTSIQDSLSGQDQYHLADKYRLTPMVWLALLYACAVIMLAGWQGFRSIIGLVLSVLVLILFIVPRIISGADPVMVTIIGAAIIVAATLFITHGFTRQTTIALIGTLFSLVVTGILATLFVKGAALTGFASEEAFFLQGGPFNIASMKGLLLAGIIIGSLGVIDDITITQAGMVEELHRTDPKLNPWQLYQKALKIGKDHVSSMTNTLILAYAGAAFPLFLLLYQSEMPRWAALNSEIIAQEIIATLTGSLGLVFAVPLTTLMAAVAVKRQTPR